MDYIRESGDETSGRAGPETEQKARDCNLQSWCHIKGCIDERDSWWHREKELADESQR